jgi:hypothetical protein
VIIEDGLTEQGHHSWPRTTFAHTKERTQDVDLLSSLSSGNQAGHHPPEEFQAWKPVAGSNVCHDDLRRDEKDTVCDIEPCCKAGEGLDFANDRILELSY